MATRIQTITILISLADEDKPEAIERLVRDGIKSKLGFFPSSIESKVD